MFVDAIFGRPGARRAGAGGGIRTPDRLITNQLLYRTELRQPDKDASLARLVPRRQPNASPTRDTRSVAGLALRPCSRNHLLSCTLAVRRHAPPSGPPRPPRLSSPAPGRVRDLRRGQIGRAHV